MVIVIKCNYKIVISCLLLCLFGIVMVYSSSSVWAEYKFNDSLYFVKHQGLFFIVGLFLMYVVSKIDYRIYYRYSNKILLVSFILLCLVLVPGIGQLRNGSRSWFGIGSFGFQPSEVCKIALIIFVSKYLSNNENEVKSVRSGVIPILLVIFLFFGLIMLEPDFGTGMVIVATLFIMLFASNIKLSFFGFFIVFGIIGIVGLIIAAPYRMARIVSFLNPWSDPLGSGFQIIQSLYAISPSGLFGRGLGNSIQKHFYLPEPQTDFIFAIVCEELGILGIFILSCLFIMLFVNSIRVCSRCSNLFGRYLVFGLIIGIIFQACLNICIVIGLLPVTGITLPFISYGGSSLLVSMLSVGIILSVYRNS